jgi:hypothetical protein
MASSGPAASKEGTPSGSPIPPSLTGAVEPGCSKADPEVPGEGVGAPGVGVGVPGGCGGVGVLGEAGMPGVGVGVPGAGIGALGSG